MKFGFAPKLFAASLTVVSGVYLSAVFRSKEWLVGVVPDDTFYYLNIARHIAQTGVSTFDGINTTNGYHPGWMLVVTLCATVVNDSLTLLRVALGAAFVFHVLTSLCVADALKRWLREDWAWLGGTLWLVNPLPLSLALQGMEAAFYIFTIAFAIWVHGHLLERYAANEIEDLGYASTSLLGLSLSLVFLGRTEA